ncbi:hypothetical protein C2857_004518 [Epichloe festucae Fl1]|uniref:Uncharacterized protein n=1 Tax=Epichloe festucae (strain Fl1) TaxID=877507 RepID=A0A7S9KV18_EPIFF|nr:hypothetical protein C2857_004518 [Epichloe festucae Fl1]
MNGRLGRAPVKEPRDVLGVATGTGIWAVQYATANPSCHGHRDRPLRDATTPAATQRSPSYGTTSKRTPGLPEPVLD